MTISGFILKNSFRNKRRALLCVMSVAISLFLLVTLLIVLREITQPMQGMNAGLRVAVRNKISLATALPYRQLAIIEKIPGVESVTPLLYFGGTMGNKDQVAFAQFGVDAGKFLTIFEPKNGSRKLELAG
ncbi:MAG: hypothetical protein SFY80_05295 [Verrucomicrobiota bacterium]|nr:hypothetical protein [Verrucomicrobiota bacterium]